MKKNSLCVAIQAGIAKVPGLSSVQRSTNLNPDGLGQVIYYPYYVECHTVHFLEALNRQEVLDFNLYLHPFDCPVSEHMDPWLYQAYHDTQSHQVREATDTDFVIEASADLSGIFFGFDDNPSPSYRDNLPRHLLGRYIDSVTVPTRLWRRYSETLSGDRRKNHA